MRKLNGNSLIEYALPLAVLFLAGTLISIVADLPGRFQGLMAHTMQAEVAGATMEVQPLGNSASIPVPAPEPQSLTLPSGEVLSESTDTNDPELFKSVETSGANGATRQMMDRLIALADQLLDDGEITFEQAFALKKLANQGHTIANVEAAMEGAIAAGNPDVTYNGRTYTFEDLGNTIGYQTGTKSDPFLNDPFNAPLSDPSNNHLNHFKKLFNETISSGALNDPATRAVVTQLTGDVLKLAGELELKIDLVLEANGSADDLRQAMISDLTHYGSAGICRSGKYEDSGKHCS